MTLSEIIEENKQSCTHIAEKVGMSKGTFNNKMKGNNGAYFSPDELDRIKKALADIGINLIKFAYE